MEGFTMTWQPGQPVVTASDHDDWMSWSKARKLELQRARRSEYPRIDYYPGQLALAAIQSRAGGRDYSSVIDELVLAGADELPE
jgi:hypothetical protein